MTTLRQDELSQFDLAIDGIGFMLASPEETGGEPPYRYVGQDEAYENTSLSEDITENKLDRIKWSSQRSWHGGQGQARLDVPGVSDDFAYLSSKGIDVGTKGQATLIHETSEIFNTNPTGDNLMFLKTVGDSLFVGDGAANNDLWRRYDAPGGAATTISVNAGGDDVWDCESDGQYVYFAIGSNGVHRVDTSTATASHWSDAFARAIGFAKGRLYGIDSATALTPPYRLTELAAAAGSSVKHTFTAVELPIHITELGAYVYIPTRNSGAGRDSTIYAYDGSSVFTALNLPQGDVVLGCTPFSGTGMLIACVRKTTNASGAVIEQQGLIYLASQLSTGHLALGNDGAPLVTLPTTTEADGRYEQGQWRGFEWRGGVYFPWPFGGDGSSGLGVYYPATGAVARHLYANYEALIENQTEWQGRIAFSINIASTTRRLMLEQNTYVASGQLVSSVIDLNLDPQKQWLVQETRCKALASGTSFTHEYSTDAGTTWAGSATESDAGDELLQSALSVKSREIQYRVTLTANGAKTSAPTLRKAGFGGLPAEKPRAEHRLILNAFPNYQTRAASGDERTAGWDVFSALKTRRDAGQVYEYQPPWWRHDTSTLRIRVAHLETLGPWGSTGPRIGGFLVAILKEVP